MAQFFFSTRVRSSCFSNLLLNDSTNMSEVEVCQFAYDGNINDLRIKVSECFENIYKSDQVSEMM